MKFMHTLKHKNMSTLKDLKDALSAKFADLETTINENSTLTQEQMHEISVEVDQVHETWNENLPKRPNS